MESEEQVHSHYWPGEGCIPITPQAVRFGYVFPVYVTKSVWSEAITWTPQKGKETSAEKRIYDLLDSCYKGMGKALASEPDMVFYRFKHWFWDRGREKSKKPVQSRFGARLLLDPETDEPWLLIFDPEQDGEEVLKSVDADTEDGRNDEDPGELRVGDSPAVDDGIGSEFITAVLGPTKGS